MYDLRRLRAFHAVAEHGSFSAAALELGYAQSVVSHHVAALEQEFGLTLIDRGTRPVSVTDAGRRLLTHAAAVLGHVAAAEDELRAVAGLESGTLRIGAFQSALTSFVPAAIAQFERAHPEVELELFQLERPDATRRVRTGELDLAVTWSVFADPEPGDESFDRLHLADDPYRLVVGLGHRLARRRAVRLGELARERFNVPPAEGFSRPYRLMLDELCAAAGFEPDIGYVIHDVVVGRALCAAGVTVALMPDLAVSEPRSDVAVVPVRDIAPFRSVHALWLRGRRVPAASRMVRYLADAAAERLPPAQRAAVGSGQDTPVPPSPQ